MLRTHIYTKLSRAIVPVVPTPMSVVVFSDNDNTPLVGETETDSAECASDGGTNDIVDEVQVAGAA